MAWGNYGRFFSSWAVGVAAIFAFTFSSAADAQFSKSYNFLEAVKDRDGTEATKFINEPGSVIVNTRDITTGDTALHITVARRDATWTGFLLQKGANPDIRNKQGITPLMLATQLRFLEGMRTLISKKATVDEPNNQGETPLIRAVQLRDSEMVRFLLESGANPDLTDTLAGLSARDYAARDRRAADILAEIEKADGKEKPAENGRFYGPEG